MAAWLPVYFLVPIRPVKCFVYVVTGSAGQGIKFNIAVVKMIMLFQILAVTAVTRCDLLVCIFHRVNFDMNRMTGRTIDVLAVV
jgi:hypothetical protein